MIPLTRRRAGGGERGEEVEWGRGMTGKNGRRGRKGGDKDWKRRRRRDAV